MKKRMRMGIGLLACLAAALAGCGQATVPETVNVTSLAITDKGEVTSFLVEEFGKEYYNLAELTGMAMEEAAAYNTAHPAEDGSVPVAVENVELLSGETGKVLLSQRYDSTATYSAFNDAVLFYGTVAEAILGGYDLSDGAKNVKDGSVLSEDQMMSNSSQKVVVTDVKAVIYAPGRVVGISDGSYQTDGTVDTTGTEGQVILLLK